MQYNEDIITAIFKQLENGLNEEADKLIEQKTEEFRKGLVYNKNVVIAELLRSIEIVSEKDPMSYNVNFNIFIRPRKRGILNE